MADLVIVESPAKARTISKFLGRRYIVRASMGHVRDLPKSQLGVDIEHDFAPKYITVRGQGKVLQSLKAAAKKADRIYLATDPDREGEAISWHLAEALDLGASRPLRIEFHEVTKPAVQRAIKHPRPIDQRRVDAQQARRILDRLVGYRLSPLLWAKVRSGLSAGRVQSVALRLICDREREIESFVPQEYWTITAALTESLNGSGRPFSARLFEIGSEKAHIPDQARAEAIVAELREQPWRVEQISRREKRRNPAPPFTTSTLQQEASRKLGFTARRTMLVAQQLYEGLDVSGSGTTGLITYLRTDSTRIAAEAQAEAREWIAAQFGEPFLPEKPPQYRTRREAQGAHEAIRPTSIRRHPDAIKADLTRDQYRLYKLIWERFVASQMAPAVLDTVTIDIRAGDYRFRANGQTVKFAGFMQVYVEQADEPAEDGVASETTLPNLEVGQPLILCELEPKQHFTQPPPRFTEAMLVRTLEELGIGRPSTYVQIIDTIQKRGYVVREERRFVPTELGRLIVDLLKEHFPDIVDVEFTANMEERLDQIEEGDRNWVEVLREFFDPFEQAVHRAQEQIGDVGLEDEESDVVCERCGRRMVIKWGRYGRFLACPGFPDCKNTKPVLEPIGVSCPECGGEIVSRRSRRGRTFYGCARYPDCHFTSWQRPVPRACPVCGRYMVEKRRRSGRIDWVCSDKSCGHSEEAPDLERAGAGIAGS
ncbi:MAG TPA: type I DNA topoisomerase [Limnochordia bacterium]